MPRKKRYTIIGLWWDAGEPWVEFGEGETAAAALESTLRDSMERNAWDAEMMKDLVIVEVVDGHHAGMLGNREVFSSSEAVRSPKDWRPGERRDQPY